MGGVGTTVTETTKKRFYSTSEKCRRAYEKSLFQRRALCIFEHSGLHRNTFQKSLMMLEINFNSEFCLKHTCIRVMLRLMYLYVCVKRYSCVYSFTPSFPSGLISGSDHNQ